MAEPHTAEPDRPIHRLHTTATAVWILITIILLSGAISAVVRGTARRPNYGSMQAESTYVWQHGHSPPDTKLFGYLPAAVFYLWPCMVWTPHPVGAWLYALLNLAYAVLTIWLLHRYWRDPAIKARPPTIAALFAWPVLIVAANLQHSLQANQLTLVTLVLCVGGLTLIGRNRQWSGGLLVGMAGLIKVLPFFLLGLLILRRKWRALGGVLVAVLVFDLVPSLLFFGPAGTVSEHLAWRQRAGVYNSIDTIGQPLQWGHVHKSDASLAAVLARWLREPPDGNQAVAVRGNPPAEVLAERRAALGEDEYLFYDARPLPADKAWAIETHDMSWAPRFHLLDLSASAVTAIWAGLLTGIAAGLFLLTWFRPAGSSPATAPPVRGDWFALAALWMVAMFFVTPLMRHYYLAWAFPAVVVVYDALVAERTARPGTWTGGTILAAAALAGWVVGALTLGWDVGRWYGIHLAASTLLAAATAWACLRLRRQTAHPDIEEPSTDAPAAGRSPLVSYTPPAD